jgi:hypothetical protein
VNGGEVSSEGDGVVDVASTGRSSVTVGEQYDGHRIRGRWQECRESDLSGVVVGDCLTNGRLEGCSPMGKEPPSLPLHPTFCFERRTFPIQSTGAY